MGFLTGPPSYRESLSASPHGAQNTDTLDLKAQTVRNQKTRVEWGLICSLGWCAVDASLVLSLASHFSQGGAFGYSAAYGLPACTLFRGYGLIARALPQAARGLFIPLLTSPGQQALCPAVRQLSRPLALLPRVPHLTSSPQSGAPLLALATPMLAPPHQPSVASAQRCVG